jgi:hypothetical protein
MVMIVVGGGNALGSLETNVVLGNYRLEVKVYRGFLNYLNGMELGNDTRMTFFE